MLSVAAFAVVVVAGCDVDAEFRSPMVIDKIEIHPDDWKLALNNEGRFDYYYCDIPIPEINEHVLNNGTVQTFWRYGEGSVDVQEPLPAVINISRYGTGGLIEWTETISCNYSVGLVRIMISRSNFDNTPIDQTRHFRTVILW
jgi:hypothetical protein